MSIVLFRADSSLHMGTGHVIRCLSMADELRRLGTRSIFVTRRHDGHLVEEVEARGYEVHALPAPDGSFTGDTEGARLLAVPLTQDLEETLAVIDRIGASLDWIVTDHYGIDARWEAVARAKAKRMMAIDDLFDRPHDCDLLLNQSFLTGAERYRELTPPGARILVGPRFALLRPQFAKLHDEHVRKIGSLESMLVLFGGVDRTDITARAVRAIAGLDTPPRKVDVVVGLRYPYRDKLAALVATLPGAKLHVQVDDPAPMMAGADLAVGAGGTTTWERCSVGLPSVVVAVAENQYGLSQGMADGGYLSYLGPAEAATEADIRVAIEALRDPERRRRYAERGKELVDGRGALRVVEDMQAVLRGPSTRERT